MLDLRHDPAPVLLVDITSSGWDSAIRQADNVSLLIDRIETGTRRGIPELPGSRGE